MLNEREARVIEFIQRKGPSLPIDIAKYLGIDSLLASAIISGLINKGYIKYSHRKVGSSPLYYIPGQEDIVRRKLYPELNDLEKKALKRLEELRVAFREDLYPQERVLLTDLKDFVSYLQIKKDDKEFYCWKHYSVSDEEFQKILKERLEPEELKQEIQEQKQEELTQDAFVKEEPVKERQEIKEIKLKPQPPKEVFVKKEVIHKEKKSSTAKKKEKSVFEKKAMEFLSKNNAEILTEEISRTESNYVINIKTPFGIQKYLVKAKNKKSISEGDLSKAYLDATTKKMPVIILTPSTPTKKAMEFIKNNFEGFVKIITLK
jgi:DNA-binding MarR family transcriptional regulator